MFCRHLNSLKRLCSLSDQYKTSWPHVFFFYCKQYLIHTSTYISVYLQLPIALLSIICFVQNISSESIHVRPWPSKGTAPFHQPLRRDNLQFHIVVKYPEDKLKVSLLMFEIKEKLHLFSKYERGKIKRVVLRLLNALYFQNERCNDHYGAKWAQISHLRAYMGISLCFIFIFSQSMAKRLNKPKWPWLTLKWH